MTSPMVRLTIRLLGAPEVHLAEAPLALNQHKARALLFYLAATGQPHTRDHLTTLLWSESPASDARHSLRSTLYRIRQALRPSGADATLVGEGDQVRLQPLGYECDVVRFGQLVSEGHESALTQAVETYRGPFLHGFTLTDAPQFEEWARFEETRLNQAYLEALHRLADWAEARQEWAAAIGYVQRIVQRDPVEEVALRRLMKLRLRNGEAALALRHYHHLAARLQQELNLTPSPETLALFHEALRQQRGPTPPAESAARPAPRKPPILPFVGRDALLARLLAVGEEVRIGRGATVLVQGEGGIGKSRLLEELAARLSTGSSPWMILQSACSPFDELLVHGPFLEIMQSLAADDLPADSSAVVLDARGRFFWRVLQALRSAAASAPLLLAIEDLQWANSSTLNLFGFLAMRLRHLPVMMVGTVQRAEAIPALQRLVTLGRRRGELHVLSLAPLPLEAVTILLRVSGVNPESVAALADWLHERSGGSPFILTEILAQLRAESILTPMGAGWELDPTRWLRWRATFTLPETTYDLVAWRLGNLSTEARRLLDVLAVAGQPLAVDLLRGLLGCSSEQLLGLADDGLARGLILETAAGRLSLPHHLLRETLLHHLSHLRRRAIHRQLAERFESPPSRSAEFPPWQIALHAVAGEDVERARRYGLGVLADLPQNYTGAETVDFLHHLHDLLTPSASAGELLPLTLALGWAHQSLGQLETAARWLQQNLDLARQTGDVSAQAAAQFEISELALVSNDYRTATRAAQAGLEVSARLAESGAGPLALVARGQRLLGAALAMEGSDLLAAERHLRNAIAAHRPAHHPADLCAALFELGNVAAQRGELARALDFYAEAARAAEAGRVYYYLALARNNFAYHSLLLGRPEAARQAVSQGLKLAETHEMLSVLLFLYSTQGEIHLYLGEWSAATESFQRGFALAEELNNLERQAGYRAGLALAARGEAHQRLYATTLLEEALALIGEQGYWHLQTRLLLWLAETLLMRGQTAEARPHLDAALTLARAHGRALLTTQAERLRARLLAEAGDWPAADALFAETQQHALDLNLPLEVARTQAAWGAAALRHSPNPDEGRARLAQARATLAVHDARAELAALP
jgi:DNA-binding SARP family transcriptional activator